MNQKVPGIQYLLQAIVAFLAVILLNSLFLHFFLPPVSAQATIEIESSASTKIHPITAFNLSVNPSSFIPAGLEHTTNPNEGGRGIILPSDDRVPMTSHNYPWSAIGRIEGITSNNQSYICTGELITSDIVLTNAHCIINAETHQPVSVVRFMPNLINGRLRDDDDIAFVTDAYAATDFRDRAEPPHPDDWALLKLEKPLGEKYGTIGISNLPVSTLMTNYQGQLVLPGYSFDFPPDNPSATAGVHEGCSILDQVNGVIVHDCDTRSGSSGGPILAVIDDEFRIVALNSAEYADESTGIGFENYGISVARILATIQRDTTR